MKIMDVHGQKSHIGIIYFKSMQSYNNFATQSCLATYHAW